MKSNSQPDSGRLEPPTENHRPTGSPRLIVLSFAVIYLVWGSTYLAIRVSVETIPPFLMSAARFVVAGGLMLVFLRQRGAAWPTPRQWGNGAIAGTLLLLGGNALVGLAEKTVASNIAALLIAMTPAWFALLNWLRPGGTAPTRRVLLGIAVGFSGVAWLVGHQSNAGAAIGTPAELALVSPVGLLLLVSASLLWAAGSLFVKHVEKPASPFVGAAVQMLAGGVVVFGVACALGEVAGFRIDLVSRRSWAAWLYLISFGSWLGYSAYNYLLAHVSSATVSTYAFVNPVIAVALGWWLADEVFAPRMIAAAGIIVAGVVIITWPARVPNRTSSAPVGEPRR